MRVSACLWAKTFRDAGASELGYASICFGDLALAKAFNPRMEFTRDKTLMQGDDCCHFKYEIGE
jgi:hypothetical protein